MTTTSRMIFLKFELPLLHFPIYIFFFLFCFEIFFIREFRIPQIQIVLLLLFASLLFECECACWPKIQEKSGQRRNASLYYSKSILPKHQLCILLPIFIPITYCLIRQLKMRRRYIRLRWHKTPYRSEERKNRNSKEQNWRILGHVGYVKHFLLRG